MLSRLSTTSSKFFGLQVQIDARSTGISISDGDEIVVDVDYLKEFLAPLPEHAWRRLLGSVSPMYKSVQSAISQDSDHVVELLMRLELDCERRRSENSSMPTHPLIDSHADLTDSCHTTAIPVPQRNGLRSSRRRRRSATGTASTDLKYPNTDSSLPIIIITPCPPHVHAEASSSRTPYQDSAYRTRLVVPGYFLANDIHPPQLPQPLSYAQVDTSLRSCCRSSSHSSSSWKYAHFGASTMSFKEWKWKDGHWNAVLPSLEEQAERGLSARSLTTRKRSSCRSHQRKKVP
jgi:hypothetical protein